MINNKVIPRSNPTYLGFTMDYRMKGTEHLHKRISKRYQKLYTTLAALKRVPNLQLIVKERIVRACVMSVLGYGTEGSYVPEACRK